MSRLILVIPDLWAPIVTGHISAEQLPPLPNLQRFLSRALRLQCEQDDYHSLLCHLLHIKQQSEGDLPLASLSYLADFDTVLPGWYLRVDPVHLQIRRDHLSLLDQYHLQVSREEANQLVAELNNSWQDQGLIIQHQVPERWYLHLDDDPQLNTYCLSDAVGGHVQSYLLKGAARQRWQTYMNEVQMMLHASSVNTARESKGLPSINSVWLWGEGSLSGLKSTPDISRSMRVYSNDPVALGLAKVAGTIVNDQREEFNGDNFDKVIKSNTSNDIMIVQQEPAEALHHGDFERWLGWLVAFNDAWVPMLTQGLASKAINDVLLYITGDGPCQHYRLTRKHLSRWWVRSRPIAYFTR